ncbi:MAG: hypothetical protein ABGZ17_07220 [Planctomycetaceae bacterium]
MVDQTKGVPSLGRTLRSQIQWVLACRTALQAETPDSPQVESCRPRIIGTARWRAMVSQARHFFEHRSGLPSTHPLGIQVDSLATWNSQDLRTLLDHGSPRYARDEVNVTSRSHAAPHE